MHRWHRLAAALALLLAACAQLAAPPWQHRLQGDAIVLLGEVHDNVEQHRLRAGLLRRAVELGWRPAIAMEQFDVDRQADIDRARRERPHDAQHLIERSAPQGGWDWRYYQPYVQLALDHELPLVATNLPRGDATKVVRGGFEALFDSSRLAALGLHRPIAPELRNAQRREVERGHCGALPAAMLSGMANAQLARDAVIADALRRHAQGGVVLLAGNGHVRRDIGVPRWLPAALADRLFVVGYLEARADAPPRDAFDTTVTTPVAERPDPCARLR